ncbi:MAG: 3-hydroxyisobutyrate dehydrogenase [Thermoleophilaceae bacterium]|jgi:3-hydroxyisobutyrate dehydrogenase-like beta-hydroxyacid dehydrogenase|nr:3-hydroxyisobutyrate dehydrogenase [Thermoleophilaceae bacterium]
MAALERIAFLGLGIMGRPMAANLVRAGFQVTVWNRTRQRAEKFAAEHDGVHVAGTPAGAAAAAQVVITMVPDAPQVEEVLFGPNGAAEGLSMVDVAVDMSTISPTASRAIGERLRAERHAGFLDAPVTGSRPKAEDGTLTIMVGGQSEDLERARPALEAMGQLIVHAGPQGHGSMVKLINNTLAAVNAEAVAEALVLAGRAGLDPDALLEVVGAGSGNSTMLELKARPMLDRDLDPLFKLGHMLKDVRHYLTEARALGVQSPLAERAAELYSQAESEGLGNVDFAAVIQVTERLSGAS